MRAAWASLPRAARWCIVAAAVLVAGLIIAHVVDVAAAAVAGLMALLGAPAAYGHAAARSREQAAADARKAAARARHVANAAAFQQSTERDAAEDRTITAPVVDLPPAEGEPEFLRLLRERGGKL